MENKEIGVMCDDNRFELIEKYKQKLIKATNIETAKEEMKVLDSILFRMWQMGWLDTLEEKEQNNEIKTKFKIGDKIFGIVYAYSTERYFCSEGIIKGIEIKVNENKEQRIIYFLKDSLFGFLNEQLCVATKAEAQAECNRRNNETKI